MKPPQWTELQRFNPGDLVEVVPDEPGEQGAHYAAVVVERSTQPRGYTVEYDDLVEREGSDRPLWEVVPAQILRPHPPPRCTYSGEAPVEHAAVDAFLDGAWWLAVYLGVVDGAGKVRVCFPDTREVMNFDAADVRPHFEWGWGGSFRKRSALGMVRPSIPSFDEPLIREKFCPFPYFQVIHYFRVRNVHSRYDVSSVGDLRERDNVDIGTDRDECCTAMTCVIPFVPTIVFD